MQNLCTSKKFRQVSVDELLTQPVPPTTNTYEPVPHGRLYDMVAGGLDQRGYIIHEEDLRINKPGDEFFGVLKIKSPGRGNSPWDLSMGLRNTNNKRASAGVFLGTNVWMCDNLQFTAEHTFLRKHHAGTIHVLGRGVDTILGHLARYCGRQADFITNLQRWIMTPQVRDHLLVDLLRQGAIRGNEVIPIIDEFITPSQDNSEAQYDTGWGLMNSVTWIGKQGFDKNPETAAKRSILAHGVFENGIARGGSW